MKIPLYLSGTFHELRSTHFHTGIDIKTQYRTGLPVYAIQDAWVWRIAVSPYGYGKALYLMHADSLVSVYGHLQAFQQDIASYVTDKQHEKEQFAVQLYPPKGKFRFNKGDLIAYAGNSGSSAGPHLHFEIRNKHEHPLNPLNFGFDVKDTRPPRPKALALYPGTPVSRLNARSDTLVWSLYKKGRVYRPTEEEPLLVKGSVGLAVDVNDYLDGSPHRCGVYTARVYLNDSLQYAFRADIASFAQKPLIYSSVDYRLRQQGDGRFFKLFLDTNNDLEAVLVAKNRGILPIKGSGEQQIRILLDDHQGNQAAIQLRVKADNRIVPLHAHEDNPRSMLVKVMKENQLHVQGASLVIPPYALFSDQLIAFGQLPSKNAVQLGQPWQYLRKSAQLCLQADSSQQADSAFLCIQRLTGDEPQYLTGTYTKGRVCTPIRQLGRFRLAVDSLPPEVQPLNFYSGGNARGMSQLRIRICDKQTGIAGYRLEINGQWALAAYDPKYDRLTVPLEKEHYPDKGKNTLNLRVTDAQGNTTEKNWSLFF